MAAVARLKAVLDSIGLAPAGVGSPVGVVPVHCSGRQTLADNGGFACRQPSLR
jgi:hypothetical protein